MKIYTYHPETLRFISVSSADESPLEKGVWLIPAYATSEQPPSFNESQTCRFIDGLWVVDDIPEPEPEPEPVIIPTHEELELIAKAERQVALNSIVVTTQTGKSFNGNDVARGDLVSAITVLSFSDENFTDWKLANNSMQTVSLDELKEALKLALAEKSKIIGVTS